MTLDTLLIYLVASLALAVIPGPTMLLALSNGIDGGMRRASWGIAGASLGSITLIAVVALGLGSLLAASELLFNAWRVSPTWSGSASSCGAARRPTLAPRWPNRPWRFARMAALR